MKANLKENWTPKWLRNEPKGWERPRPGHDPHETNHQRVVRQRENRKAYLEAVRKAKASTVSK